MIYSNMKRPKVLKEKSPKIRKVETAGYIPAKKRIEEMIISGRRLGVYRKENYDTMNPKVDDLPIDRFRSKGVDMAEVSEVMNALEQKRKVIMANKRKAEKLAKATPETKGGETPAPSPKS